MCAIGECEGEGSYVVGDDAVCDVDGVFECFIVAAWGVCSCAGEFLDGIEEGGEYIGVVV